MADQLILRQKVEASQKEIESWTTQAKVAITQNRDDLAKIALERKKNRPPAGDSRIKVIFTKGAPVFARASLGTTFMKGFVKLISLNILCRHGMV